MKFDLLLQKNRVFIGMEDVSVTYYNEKKLEDIDQTEAMDMIREAYGNFILDDQFKNRPKRSYYPTEYQKPCRAIIIEHGALSDFRISNFNDLRKAKEAGAVSFSFTEKEDVLSKEFEDYFGMPLNVDIPKKEEEAEEER